MLELLDNYINKKIIEDFIDDTSYKPILDNYKKYKQYTLKEVLDILNIKDLKTEMTSINEDIIYKSDLHGIKHNRRVIFYAYFISYIEKINKEDLRIVLDGCKYHDIGRINDLKDDLHGKRGANMIIDYINYEDINYLQAIIEIHSIDESNIDMIVKKYDVNKKRFDKMFKILKDADNLDRVRLDKTKNYSWLDPNYLRLNVSHKLVKIARQLNGGNYD